MEGTPPARAPKSVDEGSADGDPGEENDRDVEDELHPHLRSFPSAPERNEC